MKKLLLLLLACVACCTNAYSEGCYYARGMSGFNWVGRLPIGNNHDLSFSTKTGFFGSAALGYRFNCSFRIEGEYFYQRNEITGITASINLPDFQLELPELRVDGNLVTNAYMVNFIADTQIDFIVQPYFGLGFGYAQSRINISGGPNSTNTGTVAQVIVGLKYPLTCAVDLLTEYRLFVGKEHLTCNTLALGLGLNF